MDHEFATVLLFGAIIVVAVFDLLAIVLGRDSRKDSNNENI